MTMYHLYTYFSFSSRRRHTSLQGDWSSDVCSSDLVPPVLRWQDTVSLLLENAAGQASHRVFVFDEQDRFRPARRRFHGPRGFAGTRECGRRTHFRQINFERRAESGLAVDPYVPAGLFYDTVNGRQSKAGPLTGILRREEWVEGVLLGVLVHSDSGITNRQRDVA